jgi:hypothetical protein
MKEEKMRFMKIICTGAVTIGILLGSMAADASSRTGTGALVGAGVGAIAGGGVKGAVKGGLMYEAAVAGQKFSFEPL